MDLVVPRIDQSAGADAGMSACAAVVAAKRQELVVAASG